MRVLLSNHHLRERAGSELYVWELGSALRELGHDARVFTLLPGAVSNAMRAGGLPVFTPDDEAALWAFRPEVLHVHHGPCLWYLGGLGLDCPALYSSLGVIPPHEAPPAAWPGVGLGAAVSEEVQKRLEGSAFGRAVPLRLMRNWFDDRGWTAREARPPTEVRRLAVVTNHLDGTLAAQLEQLRARRGLDWVHFGLPHRSIALGPDSLRDFDAVITIGRTALLTAALGLPCLLHDVHGCDGLITPDRLASQATVNFSGRLTRHRPSLEELEQLLFVEAPRTDVAGVQAMVLESYRLTTRAREWTELYRELIAGPTRLDADAQLEYRPSAALYGGALSEAQQRERHLAEVEALVRQERDRAAELQRALDLGQHHWSVREQQLQSLLTFRTRQLEGLEASAGVRLIRSLQRVRALQSAYLLARRTFGT